MMVSLILLAGGKGRRLGEETPKQYLSVRGKPLALHSLDTFFESGLIQETVVVCHPEYQSFFLNYPVLFALPGKERQDSAYSGLQKCSQEIVLIHDAARPFVNKQDLLLLLDSIHQFGAAALASKMTSTIKEVKEDLTIQKTLKRDSLWEMHTPQGAKKELFLKGYEYALRHQIALTDDLQALELIGCPAKVVPSTFRSLKVTTKEDLRLCATS